jgi:predicted GH43/DUF377 family glycosyl hydrolase
MDTIFDSTLSTRTGLGDIGVTVDPFTGEACTYLPTVTRYPGGPVINREIFLQSVREQILKGRASETIDAHLRDLKDTFNVGVAHVGDGYVMMVRFQNAARFNHVFLAHSTDGIHWSPTPELLQLPDLPLAPAPEGIEAGGLDIPAGTQWHPGVFYDPRITQMDDGTYLVALAVDYDTIEPQGRPYINICDNVLYRTRDFERFEFVATLAGNTRNCVIFPRKIDGWYYAAGRPNTSRRVHTALMRSRDLKSWEQVDELFAGGHAWMVYAGPGFPPFETEDCWVLGVHGVETHGTFQVVYRAGVCLLDKKTLQVAAGPVPILHPEQQYEMDGVVNNVIFPTGVLFGDGSGCGVKAADVKVAIYYGAADSAVGVGLTTVGRLIDAARGRYDPFRR